MKRRHDLTDAEWSLIAPLLPNKPRGVPRTDDRRVISGIFYILRMGAPWRDLPERYGPYTTVYNRYNRWAKAGVWLLVFETLVARQTLTKEGKDEQGRLLNSLPDFLKVPMAAMIGLLDLLS